MNSRCAKRPDEDAEPDRIFRTTISGVSRRLALLVALLIAIAPLTAQADVTGEWEATYQTPLGPQELKIYLAQEGPRITGHTSSEFGEFAVRGSINGADIKLSWSEVDAGKTLEISVIGKIDGDKITGTAKLGDRGEGPFRAERTGS
jgi:hypothetical protein